MKQEPASRATVSGSRTRSLTGTFGPIEIAVLRARPTGTPEGGTAEWEGARRCGPISDARLPPTR